jgi:hypothetical protein
MMEIGLDTFGMVVCRQQRRRKEIGAGMVVSIGSVQV